jgi:hypothetical protein
MKMAVLWHLVLYSLIEIDRHFRPIAVMEAVSSSETLVSFYESTLRSIPRQVILKYVSH